MINYKYSYNYSNSKVFFKLTMKHQENNKVYNITVTN